MENKNAHIFVSSVAKISDRLKFYGDASLENISLLRLIYKYACYATSYTQLQTLDKMVSRLQREDNLICLEHQSSGVVSYSAPTGSVDVGVGGTNAKPTLGAASVTVGEALDVYTFTYNDLFSGYADDAGGTPSSFVVIQLPLQSSGGKLYYDGVEVVVNQLLYDATKLTYTRGGDTAYSDYFNFYANDDDAQLPLSSSASGMAITVEEKLIENSPPTIDDVFISTENEVETVFTLSNFSSYSDPDGDNLGAIKILEVGATNTGVYKYFGSPVQVGQVITVAEISAGVFTHSGPSITSATSDRIEVAVQAATGDQSWVE